MTGAIDCRDFQVTNIVPKRGHVLVEMLPETEVGGIVIPDLFGGRAASGVVVREGEKHPLSQGIVRKLGPADPKQPFEFGLGDRVCFRFYAGTLMRQPPRQFKLIAAKDVAGVFV